MFNVYDKKTNERVKVYDVQRDKNGYPQFLIRKDNVWMYKSAKHYGAYQKRDKDTIKKIMCNHEYYEAKRLACQPPYYIDEVLYKCKKCGHEYWL